MGFREILEEAVPSSVYLAKYTDKIKKLSSKKDYNGIRKLKAKIIGDKKLIAAVDGFIAAYDYDKDSSLTKFMYKLDADIDKKGREKFGAVEWNQRIYDANF